MTYGFMKDRLSATYDNMQIYFFLHPKANIYDGLTSALYL